MSNMRGFTADFLATAEQGGGKVSRAVVGDLRVKYGIIGRTRVLVGEGWLIPAPPSRLGGNTSYYKAGQEMHAITDDDASRSVAEPESLEPPENLLELAQWFVEQEPTLRTRRETIVLEMRAKLVALEVERTARLAEVDAEIDKATTAKTALAQLNSLKRPARRGAE